jgi:hypothetical protein
MKLNTKKTEGVTEKPKVTHLVEVCECLCHTKGSTHGTICPKCQPTEKPKIIQREYIVTFRDYFDGGDRFKEFASLEEANRFIEIRENCFGKCKGHKGYIISKKLLSTLKKGENNA